MQPLKPTEVRIGNICNYRNGSHEEQIIIDSTDIVNISAGDKNYFPIELTEEWLKKFGFEHIEYRFKWQIMGLFPFQLGEPDKEGDGYTILYASDPLDVDLPKIKYVHQLQNLYFALTGEELK